MCERHIRKLEMNSVVLEVPRTEIKAVSRKFISMKI
jgi:hypothetical protein